jgi:hypothetical protein
MNLEERRGKKKGREDEGSASDRGRTILGPHGAEHGGFSVVRDSAVRSEPATTQSYNISIKVRAWPHARRHARIRGHPHEIEGEDRNPDRRIATLEPRKDQRTYDDEKPGRNQPRREERERKKVDAKT